MTVGEKWSTQSPECVFQHYFYNHVGESRAPYYRPAPGEDEKKWEAALSKKPGPGYIPVRAVGFFAVATRLKQQAEYLIGYNARMHEINNSLTAMLQKHDLVVSIRTADARRRHQALSRRCMALAAKVQVLRNRGYAMDEAEEELKKKLASLERHVMDPALEGRSEGIWARMVGVRERARALQEDMEMTARVAAKSQPETMDGEVLKKAAKVRPNQVSHMQSANGP